MHSAPGPGDANVSTSSEDASPGRAAPDAGIDATENDAISISFESGTADTGAHATQDSATPPFDAAPETALPIGDACASSAAVFGGTVAGASTLAFGATLEHSGSWDVASVASNVGSPPAMVAWNGGFATAYVDVNGDLQFATSTWTWSSPSSTGVSAESAPALAVVSGTLHVLYQADSGKYFHGTYAAATGWGSLVDPVGGTSQGFGPGAIVAATFGNTLLVAYSGENGLLYDQAWTTAGWSLADSHPDAHVGKIAPALIALTGGSSDALVAYADTAGTLYATSRSTGVWSAPSVIDTTAFTNSSFSLLPLSAGRALLAYLGTNELPYFSVYTPSASAPWSAPAAMVANSPKLRSTPALTAGVCGDDALAVLATSTGVASIRYVNGSWTALSYLDGTSGMSFASVASQP